MCWARKSKCHCIYFCFDYLMVFPEHAISNYTKECSSLSVKWFHQEITYFLLMPLDQLSQVFRDVLVSRDYLRHQNSTKPWRSDVHGWQLLREHVFIPMWLGLHACWRHLNNLRRTDCGFHWSLERKHQPAMPK